jgi:uncharacterized short protein YbdD (DUF466 family)
MSCPLATTKPVQEFIASFVEDYDWYLKHIRKTPNHLPTKVSEFVSELGIQNYSSLYVDKNNLNTLFVEWIELSPDFKKVFYQINKIPEENVHKFMDEYLQNLSQLDLDEAFSDEQEEMEEGVSEEQLNALRSLIKWCLLWMHDLTSLMVHGERIFSLVQKAINGNRSAMLKVLQTDPSSFQYIPEFQKMHAQAVVSRDKKFLNSMNHYINNRVGQSKLTHRIIYTVIFLLDTLQILGNMTNKDILDLCDASGLSDYDYIPDPRTIGLIRNKYLDAHK